MKTFLELAVPLRLLEENYGQCLSFSIVTVIKNINLHNAYFSTHMLMTVCAFTCTA